MNMYRTESIIHNLLDEVNLLSYRSLNIKQAYRNTSHHGLRERLFYENQLIFQRLNEIFSISKILKKRNSEKISFSNLLFEKCKRIIAKRRIEKNLFF